MSCVFSVFMMAVAHAAPPTTTTRTWTGNSTTSDNWSDAANWDNGAPVNGDILVFPAGANRTQNVNNITALSVKSITISGSGYQLSGNALTLSASPSLIVSVNATISLDIALGNNSGCEFSVDTGANLILSGVVSGNKRLTKSGVGTLTLKGTNTYTSNTSIDAGTVVVANDSAFGTGKVTVATATLQDNGVDRTIANDVAISGTVTLDMTANWTFSGVVSGGGNRNLIKNSTFMLTLSGTAPNTYGGTTTVNAGSLELSKDAGVNAIAGTLVIGDGTGTDTVNINADNQIADTSVVTISSSGVLKLNNNSESIGSLTGTGSVVLGSATLTLTNGAGNTYGGVISGTGGFTLTGGADFTLSGNNTYTGLTSFSGIANQPGLLGQYYNDPTNVTANPPDQLFTTLALTRVDPTVDFDTGGSFGPGVNPDHFSVRWTGRVTAQFTEDYTFYTVSDDGVRLFVNNVVVINHFDNHGPTEDSAVVSLEAGKSYDIKMEYYENGGGATARLLWSSASTTKAIIPSSQLLSAGSGVLYVNGTQPQSNIVLSNGATIGGTGTVGSITATDSSIAPGLAGAAGTLTAGATILSGVSSFNVDVGTAAADKLNVTTATTDVDLGITSNLVANVAGSSAAGNVYTIIATTRDVLGTFANAADGDVLTIGGRPMRIAYNPNSVTLTDEGPADIVSIVRTPPGTTPTNAQSVDFTVTFNDVVQNVDATDFSLVVNGVTGASITNIASTDGKVYIVTVDSGTGDGDIRLDLNDADASITNVLGDPLVNKTYTNPVPADATYTFDKTLNVTIDALTPTTDRTPPLSGTIDDPNAVIKVTINGVTYTATNNGTTWTLADNTITPPLPDGDYDVDVVATDAVGNTSMDTDTLTVDSAPTITLNDQFSNVFSPAVTGTVDDPAAVVIVEVSQNSTVVYTSTAGDVTITGSTWTLPAGKITPDLAEGIYDLRVNATDVNNLTSPDVFAKLTIDQSAPKVLISTVATSPTNLAVVQIALNFTQSPATFAENVTLTESDFTGGTPNILLTNATYVAGSLSGSGASYTFNVATTPNANSTVTVDVAATLTDSAGNLIDTASTTSQNASQGAPVPGALTFDVDRIRPTPVITTNVQGTATNATTLAVTVTFDEPVSGFVKNDIKISRDTVQLGNNSNGVSNFAGGPSVYTFDLDISTRGTYVIDIGGNAASDAAGNKNVAATYTIISTDGNVVTVTPTTSSPTKATSIVFGVFFASPITDTFDVADVDVSTSTAGGPLNVAVGSSNDNQNFTITVTGMSSDGDVKVFVKAGATASAIGPNLQSNTASVTYDTTAPTISIGAPSVAETSTGPVTYTVTYSGQSSITLSTNDVTLIKTGTANGTVGVAGNVVTISGITGDGTLAISIAAGTAVDAAGNQAAAAGPSTAVTVDNTPPTVSISAPSVSATNNGPVTFTVTYSGASGISLASGDIIPNVSTGVSGSIAVTGSGNTRTVTITNILGEGTFGISIAAGTASDVAGNTAPAAGPSATFVVDKTAPTVTVAQANTQNDPTTSATIQFTVTFSEPVNGFDQNDVVIGGTANPANVSVSPSGRASTFTVGVSGMTQAGTVTATINASAATDDAGNASAAPTVGDNSVTFTPVPPTVTIVKASTQNDPTNASPVHFTVTFDQVVNGFTGSGVSISGTATVGTVIATLTAAPGTYDIQVPVTSEGTVIANVAANVATSTANVGNSAAPASAQVTVDLTAPTLTISSPSVSATNAGPVTYTITYTGASALDTSKISLVATGTAAGALSTVADVPNSKITVTISGITGDGTLAIQVASGSGTDTAGNPTAAAGPSEAVTVDNSVPQVSSGISAGTTTGVIDVPVTFSVGTSESGLTYTWDFGDNTTVTTTNGSVTHTFTVAQTYLVKVTITDAAGNVTVSTMSFAVTAAAGAGDICAGLNPVALTLPKLGVKLSFAAQNKDSLSFSSGITLNAGFNPNGQVVQYQIGGITGETTLNDKGASPKSTTVKVGVKYKKPKTGTQFTGGPGKISISLKSQNLSTIVLGGVQTLNATTATTGVAATAEICVVLKDHQAYHADKAGVYKAKQGKTGSYKSNK